MQVVRNTLYFWKEEIPGQTKNYPCFCDYGIDVPEGFTEPCFMYGFPSVEYNGLRKVRNFDVYQKGRNRLRAKELEGDLVRNHLYLN